MTRGLAHDAQLGLGQIGGQQSKTTIGGHNQAIPVYMRKCGLQPCNHFFDALHPAAGNRHRAEDHGFLRQFIQQFQIIAAVRILDRHLIKPSPTFGHSSSDLRSVEQDYHKRTGIFPIMHAVAVRNDLVEANPDLPAAIFQAYSDAKALEYKALKQKWYYETMPWFSSELADTIELIGENFFPYGIEANRKMLEALFRYSNEQGLASHLLTVEDLFVPSTMGLTEN